MSWVWRTFISVAYHSLWLSLSVLALPLFRNCTASLMMRLELCLPPCPILLTSTQRRASIMVALNVCASSMRSSQILTLWVTILAPAPCHKASPSRLQPENCGSYFGCCFPIKTPPQNAWPSAVVWKCWVPGGSLGNHLQAHRIRSGQNKILRPLWFLLSSNSDSANIYQVLITCVPGEMLLHTCSTLQDWPFYPCVNVVETEAQKIRTLA